MRENSRPEQAPQRVFEPLEEAEVPFHGHTIRAAKLEDGRICAVIRSVCEVLKIDAQGQIQRIGRTAAITSELLQVRAQTRGGKQAVAAITLRGFPTWILGINPGEVQGETEEAEHIRQMIIAYQVEAVDVLYQYFANKGTLALPEPRAIIVQPLEEPGPNASDEELASYHETMSLWHRWKADYHMQEWRKKMQLQQAALAEEGQQMGGLISGIQKRLGPVKLTDKHQEAVQEYVNAWCKATGKNRGIIYTDLHARFRVPRYQELLEVDWPAIEEFFRRRFPGGVLPVIQQSLFDASEDGEP